MADIWMISRNVRYLPCAHTAFILQIDDWLTVTIPWRYTCRSAAVQTYWMQDW